MDTYSIKILSNRRNLLPRKSLLWAVKAERMLAAKEMARSKGDKAMLPKVTITAVCFTDACGLGDFGGSAFDSRRWAVFGVARLKRF